MKKHLIGTASLFLALCMLCTGVFAGACAEDSEAYRNAGLDQVFGGGGIIRLVPADPEQPAAEGSRLLGISPDGSAVIREDGIRTRDGKVLPITLNTERGIGNPFNKEKIVMKFLQRQPGQEGLSWSEDGRYAAISDCQMAGSQIASADAAVLDVSNGEVYLADSFSRKRSDAEYGVVLLNRIDRAGKYLYYLATMFGEDGQSHLCFCRCPVEGGEREILYDIADNGNAAFDVCSGSCMYETADGSWMLAGTDRNSTDRYSRLAVIRFSDSGDGWTAQVHSLPLLSRVWWYSLQGWSSISGYGLFCLKNSRMAMETLESAAYLMPQSETAVLVGGMIWHVGLLRIRTSGEITYDVWYLAGTGEGEEDVKLFPATDYLNAIRLTAGNYEGSEESELSGWLGTNGTEQDGSYFPNGYDSEKNTDELNRLLPVTCTAVSPDGNYALVNAGKDGRYRLYMIRLETMEVLPVEAPEGVAGVSLTDTPLGTAFRPGIVWNRDGTLLIEGTDGPYAGVHAFTLETEVPAHE